MKIIIKIIIILMIITQSLIAQDEFDSCNCDASRIVNTFERLKSQYIKLTKEKLLYYLNIDTILKNNFLVGDSIKLKNLKLKINPILKLDYEARKFKFGENICKYFEFDTINFECVSGFFLNDTLRFFITRGHNDCDIDPLFPGGSDPGWCSGESSFEQYFYKVKALSICHIPTFRIQIDSNLIFWVDYFPFPFEITNKRIRIYP
ncbi:MAG: hypothetical protein ABSG15_05720, partial [FCB group bacterium]